MTHTHHRTLHEIIGDCDPAAVTAFKRAIKDKDPNRIAETTARLVSESDRATLTLYYAAAFAPFVARHARPTTKRLKHQERRRLAQNEWKRLSTKRDLPSDPFLKRLILLAVTRSLR